MNIVPLIEALPNLLSAISPDSNVIAACGMVLGVTGGWLLTSYTDQLKAKKARIRDAEQERRQRRPEE